MIKDIIKLESKNFEMLLQKFFNEKKAFYPKKLADAMEYSLFSGGKRIRPVLSFLVADFLDINRNKIIDLAIALELIHNYSLIHDDLPCMDNDDYRRGKLTSHKVFGEDFATLAGDALLNLAYETILETVSKDNKLFISALILAKCAGAEGMIGGQADELDFVNSEAKDILDMYIKKTAMLFKAAVLLPAYLHINEAVYNDLQKYGEKLGLIFQLTDDLLDADQNEENTYLSIAGKEGTHSLIAKLNNEIKDLLSKYADKAHILIELAEYISARNL